MTAFGNEEVLTRPDNRQIKISKNCSHILTTIANTPLQLFVRRLPVELYAYEGHTIVCRIHAWNSEFLPVLCQSHSWYNDSGKVMAEKSTLPQEASTRVPGYYLPPVFQGHQHDSGKVLVVRIAEFPAWKPEIRENTNFQPLQFFKTKSSCDSGSSNWIGGGKEKEPFRLFRIVVNIYNDESTS